MQSKNTLKIVFAFCLICSMVVLSSCSSTTGQFKRVKSTHDVAMSPYTGGATESIWRPSKTDSIPFVMNDRVEKWVKIFNGSLQKNFTRWMFRLGYYGPTISAVLKEEGVPQDLVYLAMIESGFNTTAISTASAVGPWQFISSTGKNYGLDHGFFVDDRRDVIKATQAAARHLKDLYKVYGDWYLAFSAYNAGPGKVNRAIKNSGTNDYWKLSTERSHYLKQETKDYVPRILAAMHIVKNYKKFGYTESSFARPMQYERVIVPDSTHINVLAKSAGTSPDVITTMNPSLMLGITPPGKSSVLLPKGSAEQFKRNYAQIRASDRVSEMQYQAGSRDSISSLASKYHLNVAKVTKANNIKNPDEKLKPGTIITVPIDNSRTLVAMAKYAETARSGKGKAKLVKETKTYKVRSGDTIQKIANANKITAKSLAKMNGLATTSRLKPGQKIKIVTLSKKYENSFAGGFLTGRGQPGRLSGVKQIIIQNSSGLPEDFLPPPSNKIERPQLIATASIPSDFNEKAEMPAVVNTPDTTVSDSDATNSDQPNKSATSVPDNDLPGQIITDTPTEDIDQPTKVMSVAKKEPPPAKLQSHVVLPGETLSSIALRNNMRLSEIISLNNLNSANIRVGQKLVLNTAPATTHTAKPVLPQNSSLASKTQTKANALYVVKPGDNLVGVANKHQVTVTQIKDWNKLASTNIKAGQQLKILRGTRETSPSHSKSLLATGQDDAVIQKVIFHSVKPGETIWSLSQRYHVKVSDIIKWNNLKDAQVRANQKIKIIALNDERTKTKVTL